MSDQPDPARAIRTIAVIGGGAWGTALAITAAAAGRSVRLWAREAEVVAAIRATRQNALFLPGISLDASIEVTDDLAAACDGADAALLVAPSQFVRAVAAALHAVLPDGAPVISCAKGIERGTGLLMSQVAAAAMPGRPLGVLSGPTFAEEVARGQPTAVTIASADAAEAGAASVAARIAVALGTRTFRPYVSDDVTGVDIGGAVKNVIAIACGVAKGAGFGSNARAALITRGLDEMKRLSEAVGGRRETVTGLAGVGDLTLTCSSEQSRNFSFGVALGAGAPRETLFDGRPVVVEGAVNAVAVTDLARRLGVEMPICEAVRDVVEDGRPIAEAMTALLTRPLRAEPQGLDIRMP